MPRLLGPALGGLALALTWPKPGLPLLAWLALVPLLRRPGPKEGFAAGLAFHLVTLHWVYSTCRFAELNVVVAALAWWALAALLSLNWLAFGFVLRRLPPKPLAYAAAWTAIAFLTERFTPRFAVDLLQYSHWNLPPMIQVAALAGPHALGFLIVYFNAALALKKQRVLAAILVAAAFVYGVGRIGRYAPTLAGYAAVLQPNVDQYEKWSPERAQDIQANLKELAQGMRAPLVVWPESTLPYYVEEEGFSLPFKSTATHVVGAVTRLGETTYNSAYMAPGKAVYHKRQLVPFGEFVPLRSLETLVPFLGQIGSMEPGAGVQPLFSTPLGTAAVSVCYEAAFPRWSRRDAARGAQLLINVTNDGWYKDTWAPYQHLYANVFRAVETGLPVVRSANTGISAVIGPDGEVLATLPLNTRGRFSAAVPRPIGPTPYVRFGDWLGWLSILITCASFFRRATS